MPPAPRSAAHQWSRHWLAARGHALEADLHRHLMASRQSSSWFYSATSKAAAAAHVLGTHCRRRVSLVRSWREALAQQRLPMLTACLEKPWQPCWAWLRPQPKQCAASSQEQAGEQNMFCQSAHLLSRPAGSSYQQGKQDQTGSCRISSKTPFWLAFRRTSERSKAQLTRVQQLGPVHSANGFETRPRAKCAQLTTALAGDSGHSLLGPTLLAAGRLWEPLLPFVLAGHSGKPLRPNVSALVRPAPQVTPHARFELQPTLGGHCQPCCL